MTAPLPAFDPDFAGPPQWAAMYRAIGLQIIPGWLPGEPAGNGSWKRPYLSQWQPLQEVLVPQAQFDRWYAPNGEHAGRGNMGLITGRCSGNAFVIDLDSHKNPAAQAWWHAVLEVENNGIDLETIEQRTGGGGLQKLFLAPAGFTVPTIKTSIGVDIRGQGGFAVLPPSLHESGQHYDWLPGRAPWEIVIETAPEWLLVAITDLAEAHGSAPMSTMLKPAIQTFFPEGNKGPAGASGEQVVNEFGTVIDGREHLMRDVVWHAVLELYRASPIMPPEAEWRLAAAQAYVGYEIKVLSRLTGAEKSEGLEREGRGTTEFFRKWRRMMRLWGAPKMVEAAAKPVPMKPIEDPAAEFQQAAASAEAAAKVDPSLLYERLDVRDIKSMPDPRWLVADLIIERALGFVFGQPGSVKTFLALDLSLSLATGQTTWWGRKVEHTGAVIYISSEGSLSDLKFRIMAWEQHRGVVADDAPFRLIRQSINFMNLEDVGKLIATVQAIADETQAPITAVIVDTVSRVLPGAEENLQKDMTLFVYACDQVRQRFDATVIGLHHTSKAGQIRGSTVIPAAGDFVIEMRREPGASEGSFFVEKLKAGEDGWEQPFKVTKLVVGTLGGQSSLVLDPVDKVANVTGWPSTETCRQVLAAIDAAWQAGKPWSDMPQARDRYAPRQMHVLFEIDAKVGRDMLERWLITGMLVVEIYDTHNKQKGLKVLGRIG